MSRCVLMDDETLKRMADRFGPQSKAARALQEVEKQRELFGIDAVVLATNRTFSVCSRRFAELRLQTHD